MRRWYGLTVAGALAFIGLIPVGYWAFRSTWRDYYEATNPNVGGTERFAGSSLVAVIAMTAAAFVVLPVAVLCGWAVTVALERWRARPGGPVTP